MVAWPREWALYINPMMSSIMLASRPLQTSRLLCYSPLKLLKAQPFAGNCPASGSCNISLLRTYTAIFCRNCCRVCSNRANKFIAPPRYYSQKTEEMINHETFIQRLRKFWRGPTFKYWFIGVTALSSWLAYYSLKSYKSTRVSVILPVAMPNHTLIERKRDVDAIFEALERSERLGGKVRSVMICGPLGSGKSILSYFVANRIMEQIDKSIFRLPKSHTSVFLCGDTLKGFLFSLQAFASRLKIRPIDIRKKIQDLDNIPSTTQQCEAILELIREKLEKHPNWVIVVNNLQQGSSEDVVAIIVDKLLMSCASSWSKGTVILTSNDESDKRLEKVPKYQVQPRLSNVDAIELLKDIANIKDEHFGKSIAAHALLQRLSFHPMATVCAGILVKDHLERKEPKSIDGVITELVENINSRAAAVINDSHIHQKLRVPEALIVAETVIAMTVKLLLDKQPHLSASFDMISSCALRTPLPAVLLARYLKHSSLHLPVLEKPVLPQSNLQQMFKAHSHDKVDETLDPKGKAWSTKSITEYITSIEKWFKEIAQAIREVYNMYYGEIPDNKVDNSIQILQDCKLLMSMKLEPGDVESYCMHPLIYAVARQHFLSSSVPNLEESFLVEDEIKFNKQPWFKKLSNYEPRANLIRFRNDHAKVAVSCNDAASLVSSYNNALINVSSILSSLSLNFEESDFRFIGNEAKVKYLQHHLNRIIQSISEEVTVSKQSVAGKTIMKYLEIHRDYLDFAHPIELTGIKGKIDSKTTSAKIASNIDNDVDKAIAEMQDTLQLLKDNDPGNSIEIASVLCQLAALLNSKDDLENGMKYLEEAIDLYELQRRKDGEYKRPLEFGKALGALGVMKGTLRDRVKSKELIERGLMLQQAGVPDIADEAQSKHFGSEFASALIDLGHAYVSLGMPLYGRKILDLALMAHKNIHGDNHPEVARTLNVLSIAHLMQGHNEESRRLRKEAGKVQSHIDNLPLY